MHKIVLLRRVRKYFCRESDALAESCLDKGRNCLARKFREFSNRRNNIGRDPRGGSIYCVVGTTVSTF